MPSKEQENRLLELSLEHQKKFGTWPAQGDHWQGMTDDLFISILERSLKENMPYTEFLPAEYNFEYQEGILY